MTRASARAILVLVATAAACSPAVDQAKLAAVQVVGTDAAVHGCRLLGTIEARDSDRFVPGGPRYETAMLDLRKKAVMGGGSHLVTDAIEPPRDGDYMPTFVVRARLFACAADGTIITPAQSAPEPPPPSKPAVAAAPLCEPDCSPGYTCIRGTCVSACNPLCAHGERCGTDRICHPVSSTPAPAPLLP
jgi:hypothetical protein